MTMKNSDYLKEKANQLPEISGVYMMLDNTQKIIYVGKAKSLKSRVKQYFSPYHKDVKTQSLISHIKDFNVIVTKNEYEALLLENNLIKQYRPHYNFLLKDDKTYAYIKLDVSLDFPTLEVARKFDRVSKYFGPFLLGVSASKVLALIHDLFPIRNCKRDLSRRSKPCLEFHLGRCLAPCTGNVKREEYAKVVNEVELLLSGNDTKTREYLLDKIQLSSIKEEFELAIKYRDYLYLLDKISRKQTVSLTEDIDADIFSLAESEGYSVINHMSYRKGKLVASENVELDVVKDEDILSMYILQYYDKKPLIVSLVLLSQESLFMSEIESFLFEKAGRKIKVSTPKRGGKRELVELSKKNAREHLANYIKIVQKRDKNIQEALAQLSLLVGNENLNRIECFDISHTGGTNIYASMVVFSNGIKDKRQYRVFKIQRDARGDDYASMREVIERRVKDLLKSKDSSLGSKPDLVIIDGGKGQLSVTQDLLLSQGISAISLAEKEEDIYLPNEVNPIRLTKRDPALQLCQRIRDEAHRFALHHHSKRRNKEMLHSELNTISGIGEAKIKNLYLHFGSIDKIKKANIDELMAVKSLRKIDAVAIYSFYHSEK